MDSALFRKKTYISSSFLGKETIHAIGVSFKKKSIIIYSEEKLSSSLEKKILEEAKPFDIEFKAEKMSNTISYYSFRDPEFITDDGLPDDE